jgi:peptide/nickel transport system permease protein
MMIEYIFKRLLQIIPVLLLVSIISFSIIYIAPGDPAMTLCAGPDGQVDPEYVDEFTEKYGLDEPLYVQYFTWLNNILHGDFGYSYKTGQPVLELVLSAFRATMKLAIVSLIISLVISIPLGIISAIKQNTLTDTFCMLGATLGISMPNFWLGCILMLIFAVYLNWLPAAGYGESGDLKYIILPAITLGASSAAITARLMRSSMVESLSQDYILTARAKGVSERTITLKHAMKNALIPVVTMVGLNFAFLLNGSAVVETLFAWPGLGGLTVHSMEMRDYMVVQGCMIFIALLFIAVNLAVDITYKFIDPRIRL